MVEPKSVKVREGVFVMKNGQLVLATESCIIEIAEGSRLPFPRLYLEGDI